MPIQYGNLFMRFNKDFVQFQNDDKLIASSSLVALIYNTFDIFMVMYFGNGIKESSDQLSYSLFESNWVVQSKSYRKCIVILTEALRQPQEIMVCKLYYLNLETFTTVCLMTKHKKFDGFINFLTDTKRDIQNV